MSARPQWRMRDSRLIDASLAVVDVNAVSTSRRNQSTVITERASYFCAISLSIVPIHMMTLA